VRLSPRRLLIDAARSVVFEFKSGGTYTLADLLAATNRERRLKLRADAARVRRRQRAERDLRIERTAVVRAMVTRLFDALRTGDGLVMSVANVAALARRSRRGVYHDIEKGALRRSSTSLAQGRISVWIEWRDALTYIGSTKGQEDLVDEVIVQYVPDFNVALRRLIRRAFLRRLATEPPESRSPGNPPWTTLPKATLQRLAQLHARAAALRFKDAIRQEAANPRTRRRVASRPL
jgi:hypothetical protein